MQLLDNEPAPWHWRDLPDMSDERYGAGGCVLSDGRFAVFGGTDDDGDDLASCEALVLANDGPVSGGERWEALPAMHHARCGFACAAVGGCVIVAGGEGVVGRSVEVYDEATGVWRTLPTACQLPRGLMWMGSALM